MSGKAVLVLVIGIIIIAGTVMYNIEAASTRIVRNFSDYYVRQTTLNVAQSGVNLALTQLEQDRAWRSGYSSVKMLDGTVSVKVYDTMFDSIPAIAVYSIGETNYSTTMKRRDTSIAYVSRNGWHPKPLKGLLTLNASTGINGNIVIDGRNHDMSGNLLPGSGIPGVWSTKPTFTITGSGIVGGTSSGGTDYAPTNPADSRVALVNQTFPDGFPKTPDEVMSIWSQNFSEGTLKAIAQSGFMGSQYTTDPKTLTMPLKGITYVEMPTNSPKNTWSPTGKLSGQGILVVHNAAQNAVLKNADGDFKGLLIADEIEHLHGNLLGGIIGFNNAFTGNVVGNGNASILFSEESVLQGTDVVRKALPLNVIAWWE